MENDLERLKAIESEQNDLLGKLKKIEEKKATVSHEVYLKVKHDYEAKLKKLDETIAANKSLVKMELERLKKEIGDLKQKQSEYKLQLEELELRYIIGEYSEDKYKELESEAKERCAVVAQSVKQVEERINWCAGILGGEEVREDLEAKIEEIKQVEEELTIVEHILEKKVPDEVKRLDELLMETSALLESEPTSEGKTQEEKKKEEGIACPKCGYINPPDSWYCEKCGAEILAGN